MSVTIYEALQNAHYNILEAKMQLQINIGKDQLHNAVTLLEKGYDLETEVEPLLEKYETVENVPEKKEYKISKSLKKRLEDDGEHQIQARKDITEERKKRGLSY